MTLPVDLRNLILSEIEPPEWRQSDGSYSF